MISEAFHRRKRPVWVSWRMDETYIRVKESWYYLYRAVDKTGQTIDFLLIAHRDERPAKHFLTQAICRHSRTVLRLSRIIPKSADLSVSSLRICDKAPR